MKGLVPLLVLLVAGCAGLTPEQEDAVRRMQVRNVSPAFNCQNLGEVSGSTTGEGAGGARAKAVLRGGNTLVLGADGTPSAFFCPVFAPPNPDADSADPNIIAPPTEARP